jgi:serine/threonine protein kinase
MEGTQPRTLGRRFLLEHEIGRGGTGVVYQAFDRQWNARVAVKTLRSPAPEALFRLKNEFRALEGIRHPNLVRLGELSVEDGQWLFTMELVDGVDFVRWVRREGRVDLERLRSAVEQLARALRALHATGRVHRDVKPSNVLVTAQGRLVLLDFGLITRVAADDAMTDGRIVGTPGYMAPEQAEGRPVTPAADWYSLGALICEALTGAPPGARAPRLETPDDLAPLMSALLEPDPFRRAGWSEVAARLGFGDDQAHEHVEAPFVGRAAELAALERWAADARANGPLTVLVCGESGIGKSALVEQFMRRTLEREENALVLASHAGDRELVPFNGFDGIVDGLMRHLVELEPAAQRALIPDGMEALAELFPVLGSLPWVGGSAAATTAAARRQRAFETLRELLARIARERPLLLAIDDFQWAGDDALALRHVLMAGGPTPGWLLVATVRSDEDSRSFVRRATLSAQQPPARMEQIELQPLDQKEAAELIQEITGRPIAPPPSGGHPLFLAEIARAGIDRPRDLNAIVTDRVRALGPDARRLAEVLAIAGAGLRPDCAAAAAGLDAEGFARAADELRAARLARPAGAGLMSGVEPYHDRIREAMLATLDSERRATLHRAIAEALDRAGAAEPQRSFVHWLGAGDLARARSCAEAGAAQAERQLAFLLAAESYARARTLSENPSEQGSLLGRQAAALANAGKKREAVALYRRGAALTHGREHLENLRNAAEVLLQNGDIDEGATLLREVLQGVGLHWPHGQGRAILSLLAARARIRLRGLGWVERPESAIPPEQLARIDTAWSAAMALVLADRPRSADFQVRGLMLALDAGEPSRVARALTLEAGFSAMDGSRATVRTHALLAEARRVADRSGHPSALALIAAVEGVAHAIEGDFATGARELAAAIPLLRAHASRWDVMNAEYFWLMSKTLLGDLREVERHASLLADEARASDDLSLLVNLRTGYPPLAQLTLDDPESVRRAIDDAMRSWSQAGFHRQHWSALFARANCDLYEGHGERAWRALEAVRLPLFRSLLLRSQPVRIAALNLRARAAVATGRKRMALKCAARLSREGVGWADGFAALATACANPSPGGFERAAERLTAVGLRMHAATARRRASIDDPWWREQQVANPDGFVRCFAPTGPR